MVGEHSGCPERQPGKATRRQFEEVSGELYNRLLFPTISVAEIEVPEPLMKSLVWSAMVTVFAHILAFWARRILSHRPVNRRVSIPGGEFGGVMLRRES
jgi:hypothetical protein